MNKIKFLFFLTLLAAYVAPEMAHAGAVGGGGFLGSGTSFLNALMGVLTNTWVRIIAIIAVIIVGAMAMAGRLSGGLAIWVVVGMVLMFGAAAIVDSVDAVV
jgi:type IV secretory pathway VirB2 component (pilin)